MHASQYRTTARAEVKVESLPYEIVTTGLLFPEGPVALADGSVIVVEVGAGRVTRVDGHGTKHVISECGGGPGGAAVGPDGNLYVCNNGGMRLTLTADGRTSTRGEADASYCGGWIDRIDMRTGATERVCESIDGIRLAGPNDIVFDADGGFWFSDFGKPIGATVERGGICYVSSDGVANRVVHGPRVNGIALSPDGGTLYAAISHESLVVDFSVVGPGELSPVQHPAGRPTAQFPTRHILDSMAMEANGRLCVATTFAQPGIGIVDPITGGISLLEVSDPMPTNICFGGIDLRDAWITLAGQGALARARWPRPGLALHNQS